MSFPLMPNAAGRARSMQLTYLAQSSTSATTNSALALPSGAAAGDLIVIAERSLTAPSGVAPSGYTIITQQSGGLRVLSYKVLTGSETNIPAGLGGTRRAIAFAWRPSKAITSVSVGAGSQIAGNTSGNPAAQVLSLSGTGPAVLAFGYYEEANGWAVSPRTMSPAADVEQNGGANWIWLAQKTFNVAASDVTVDMDDEGNENVLGSAWLRVT